MKLRVFLLTLSGILLGGCGGGDDDAAVPFEQRLSFVSAWNELALAGVRYGQAKPTITARQLFLVSAAMYDAWSAYDAVATPYLLDPSVKRPLSEHDEEHKRRAVSQAAYHILTEQFPEYEQQQGRFTAHMANLGYAIATQADTRTPEGIGLLCAQTLLFERLDDGSNTLDGFADTTSAKYPGLYAPVNSPDPESSAAPGGEDFDPNHWQPLRVPTGALIDQETGLPIIDNDDPSTYSDQRFLTPHWGAVVPFALASSAQFRPPAPPLYGSAEPYTDALGRTMSNDEAWNAQVDQVLHISAALSDAQKVIAEFWADGPRTESPPGHWNQLAHGISLRDQHGIDDDVKLYFALNGAILDASIAIWEAKRAYDYIRPRSAIRHKYHGQLVEAWAGPNLGTRLIPGEQWRPYQQATFVTPPFPEFVSGHSGFSRAAAQVLGLFTGSEQFYDGFTLTGQDVNDDGVEDFLGEYIAPAGSNAFENGPAEAVVLRWPTFQDAADEAGISRLYGGIHIQDGDLRGREIGRLIGIQAFHFAESYWNGTVQR